MNASVGPGDATASDAAAKHTIHDSFPYVVGGGILGAVAAFFAAMVCGIVLAFANHFSGGEICGEGFAPSVIVLLSVICAVVLFAVGRWLFRLRRWIGTKADPADVAHIKRMRSRFTAGSMTVYCLLAPFVWVMATASANCAAS